MGGDVIWRKAVLGHEQPGRKDRKIRRVWTGADVKQEITEGLLYLRLR